MFLLDKSRVSLEDLREISQAAQEAKLDRELVRFEEELELFLADKDQFLENLYRRLKQVTARWRSWRCHGARDVTIAHVVSRKQIEDLIHWEQELARKKKKKPTAKDDATKEPVDMLIRFLQACSEAQELYKQFFCLIYKPLHQVFEDEKAAPLAKRLGRVLENWSSMLEPGPINHRMLSAQSADAVHNMNLNNKPHDTQFHLVLRLVPDFALKGYEALSLAKKWRQLLGTSGYIRELKSIHARKMLLNRKLGPLECSKPCDSAISRVTLDSLESKLRQSRETVDVIGHVQAEVKVINTSRENSIDVGSRVGLFERHAHTASNDNRHALTACTRDTGKQGIDLLREELRREQLSVQRIRTEFLRGELSSQSKPQTPMVVPLMEKLAVAKSNCRRLRNEISKAEEDCNFVYRQHASVGGKLNSRWSALKAGLNSFRSDRIALTRPLLESRLHGQAQSREQRLIADSFCKWRSKTCL